MSPETTGLWSSQARPMTAQALWDGATGEVVVVVTWGERRLEERFIPLYVPRWGLDAEDLARSQELSEELASRLEREAGVPPGSTAT
jgi:hypothetical protein